MWLAFCVSLLLLAVHRITVAAQETQCSSYVAQIQSLDQDVVASAACSSWLQYSMVTVTQTTTRKRWISTTISTSTKTISVWNIYMLSVELMAFAENILDGICD
jgi:hypothetical protein